MFKLLRKSRHGQSIIEYITIITILLFAWLGISQYFKRGIAGRWKQITDDLGEQYDPRVMDSSITHSIVSTTITDIITVEDGDGFHTNRLDVTNTTETRTGFSQVGGY